MVYLVIIGAFIAIQIWYAKKVFDGPKDRCSICHEPSDRDHDTCLNDMRAF